MIYISPLQGLTDYVFRNAHSSSCGGADKYFAPYANLAQKELMYKKQLRDIEPARQDPNIKLVPQIMANNPAVASSYCQALLDSGYSEVNLNFGCPHNIATSKNLGAGAIGSPAMVEELLQALCSIPGLSVSVKCRSGQSSQQEFGAFSAALAKYPLLELILHPRTAKQMYEGLADREFYFAIAGSLPFPVVYNGDIAQPGDLVEMHQKCGNVALGRGLIANPMLPLIAKNPAISNSELVGRFWSLHDAMLAGFSERMSGGDIQIIKKMYEYWHYWGQYFPDADRQLKKIKKTNLLKTYLAKVSELKNIFEPVFYAAQAE
jgi:tRNA-dihydrouridine synthase B